jgi:hypothetical protein
MTTISTDQLARLARHLSTELATRGETLEVVRNMSGHYVALFGVTHQTVNLGASRNEAYSVLAALLASSDAITTTTTTTESK